MISNDYFKYAIQNGLLDNLDWYYATMAIPASNNINNKYYTYQDGRYFVKLNDGSSEMIADSTPGMPLINMFSKIKLSKNDLINIDNIVETEIRIAIVNYLLLVNPFGKKIPYINGEVKINSIESTIAEKLTNDKVSEDGITIPEYIKFVDNSSMLTMFSRLVTVSATYKSLLPPPNIEKKKKELIKEYIAKYGEHVFKDYVKVTEFINDLGKIDDEWLKDDPAYGKLISGKVKNNARAKMFLTYGAEPGFDRSGNATLVSNSLDEGWPEEAKELAQMFNISRSGSFDRGNETQKGGSAAKVVLRATNSIKIINGDCGTKLGRLFQVTKDDKDKVTGRNIFIGNNTVAINASNFNAQIGKNIVLRSPAYCKQINGNICTSCAGEQLSGYKDGISLIVLDISAILLAISMSAMHGQALKTVKLDMDDWLS